MAKGFDYAAMWSIAKDAHDAVNALVTAIHQLPYRPIAPWAIRNPPPGCHKKWEDALKTLPERRAKAADAIRNAAENLARLLTEDRYVAPIAGVWPPSAPKLTSHLSIGLKTAESAAHATPAWKDDAYIDQPKRYAVSAESALKMVIAELERRPEIAEMAYQRQVEKLQTKHPDWSAADALATWQNSRNDNVSQETTQQPDKGGEGTGNEEPPQGITGAKMSPRELANKHDIDNEALRKRLDRWRYDHDTGYVEVSNPTPREPKYLYDESAVMPVIDAMKAKSAG